MAPPLARASFAPLPPSCCPDYCERDILEKSKIELEASQEILRLLNDSTVILRDVLLGSIKKKSRKNGDSEIAFDILQNGFLFQLELLRKAGALYTLAILF